MSAGTAMLLVLWALPNLGCPKATHAVIVKPDYKRPFVKELPFSQEIALPNACSSPVGVGWDGTGLWVPDQVTGQLWRIDPREQSSDPPLQVGLGGGLRPGPMVADPDGRVFWIVDAGAEPSALSQPTRRRGANRRVVRIPIPDTMGPLRRHRRTLPLPTQLTSIPITPLADPIPVAGLGWDGTKLWMATTGGLCACVYRIDQDNNGEPLLSFFPRCNPSGLAIDREGQRLWLSAEIGSGWGALLLGRRLVVDGTPSQEPTPRDRTQRFLALRPKTVRPRAITAAGESVWVLDVPGSGTNRLLRYKVRTGDTW